MKTVCLSSRLTNDQILERAAHALRDGKPVSGRLLRRAKQLGLHIGFWMSLKLGRPNANVMNQAIVIELKDGNDNFKVLGTIERVPTQHNGWQSVRYQGKRFVLRGGIRNNEFINVSNPIKGKVN